MGSRLEKKSTSVRKAIEAHTFTSEAGDEYSGSKFGGFADYFRRKKIKLQNLDADIRANSDDKPPIFRGVVAHVNGYTQPSLNDLHRMVVEYGGGFVQYLDGKTMVTHIVAANLTPKKAVEFRRYRVVKPAWIVESVKAGKLLPWNEFRVLDEGAGQRVIGFEEGRVVGKVSVRRKGYRDQTDGSWYTSQLQNGTSSAAEGSLAAVERSDGQTLTPTANSSFNESDIERLEEAARMAEQEQGDPLGAESHDEVDFFQQTPPDSGLVDSEAMEMAEQGEDAALSEAPLDLAIPEASPDTHLSEPAPDTIIPRPAPDSNPVDEERPQPPLASDTADLSEPPADLSDYGSTPPSPSAHSTEMPQSRGVKRGKSPDNSPRKAAKLTAEEHNTILLADPRIRKSSVVNPDFLEQYYRESRLHHLSTWKADLKSQLRALTEEKSPSQQARQKRPAGARRYILHVDFDSFFVAVSLKKCPQYTEKPCVVAHGSGSGSEIASCNYPARKFGVSNGMWMKKALELCKDLEVLPYDFPAYEEASRKFYDAILATGGIVQSVSIDEALIDVSVLCISSGGTNGIRRDEGGALREQAKADEIAEQLRKKVLEETGCNVSVGIGANILLAKVALRKAKPAGQFHLRPDAVLDFIGQLEVQNLPGVAWSLGSKLEEMGIRFVKDIRECTKEKLMTKLGPKTGEKLWDYARGIDRVEVGDVVTRKSVSAEVNWGVRFENQEQVDEFIESLCGELQKRLIKEKVKGRQLTIKIMRRAADAPLDPPKHLGHGKCDTFNKSVQLGVCTNDAKIICKEALSTMRGWGFTPGELRGIGVQMQKLEPIKGQGVVDSSQRRLHFKQDAVLPQEKADSSKTTEPIQDDIETPKAVRFRDAGAVALPMKLLGDSPSKKPLNVMGTQFVLPTQVDASVLAELPEDIRAKLIRGNKGASAADEGNPDKADQVESITMAGGASLEALLPTHSQLDAETIAALPEDVRAEVLAFYKNGPAKAGHQAVLPQSPRKTRVIPPTKPMVSRRGRGRGGLFGSTTAHRGDTSTLTQSNFVTRPQPRSEIRDNADSGTESESVAPELDAEFLAALPPELRQEVIDNHRQERLRRTGGIDLSRHQRPNARKNLKQAAAAVEKLFKLPPRPPKPSFTKTGLSELKDVREVLRKWTQEFWDDDPFPEDVEVLVGYLRDVVLVERDLDKAVRVVKWLTWLVEEDSCDRWLGDEMRARWEGVVSRVRLGVQEVVAERGLGAVDFD
ncbi:hypothetical protein ANO11243_033010 [Dothideomycetidae sp. 11243]|nr:hypothetical protein ANO11243_033010 [fungal sp. No.11243]